MDWIPKAIEQGNKIMIPHVDENRFRTFEWNDDECAEDFLKRHSIYGHPGAWASFHVWCLLDKEEEEKDGTFSVTAYEVKDLLGEEMFLMVSGELSEYEDLFHSILIPHNKFNLLKFYQEYLLPFAGKDFFYG